MARLRFITGAIRGRLGEFVGSSWKGINYIKTFTAPSNPKTPLQVKVRSVFKALSLFASALYSQGLLAFVPSAHRLTERNSVFKANQQMFRDKLFAPADLQVAPANVSLRFAQSTCTYDNTGKEVTVTSKILFPTDIVPSALKVHCLFYDFVKGLCLGLYSEDFSIPATGFYQLDTAFDATSKFNTSEGSQKADCRVYLFVSGLDVNGNKVISSTVSLALA